MLLKLSMTQVKNFNIIAAMHDIKTLIHLCKSICLPQKTVSFSLFLYYAVKDDIHFIEPDDLTLFTTILSLSCKVCETHRPIEQILESNAKHFSTDLDSEITRMYYDAVYKTQVDICEIIDFRFDLADIYSKLQSICSNYRLDHMFAKRSWVVLNDMMCTPICISFTCEEIIYGVLFIIFVALESENNEQKLLDAEVYEKFCKYFETRHISLECLKFLFDYILDLYKCAPINR